MEGRTAGRRTQPLARQIVVLRRVVRRGPSHDRKAGTASPDRLHLDAVAEQIRSALYNEQAETQTVGPAVIRALKRVEDCRQRVGADAGASIAHLDAQFRTASV